MSIKKSHKLKQLQSRAHKLEIEVAQKEKDVKEMQRDLSRLMSQLDGVQKEIESIKSTGGKVAVISEHAIIRYLERAMGLDLEQLRSEIHSDKFKSAYKAMGGNGRYPIGNGVTAVVRDGVIVSIV